MIKTTYNSDEDIIYITRINEVTIQDIIKNIIEIDNNYGTKKRLFVLDDVRGSITKHTLEEQNNIAIREIKKRIDKYILIKTAFIVDKPLDTAFTMIFDSEIDPINNYNTKVFSTIEAGKSWLLSR